VFGIISKTYYLISAIYPDDPEKILSWGGLHGEDER